MCQATTIVATKLEEAQNQYDTAKLKYEKLLASITWIN
jgi:hypothetical protein